ncbi:TetR/AcrR family transcriptional regulator [Desulfosporosinus nitroreducens]|uniref:TetR/AcrR family transcriptional regulator n=1 Tax=Desulfosporosinus nitroreducens TaxID=2018668 RepID=A0ABT8QXM1_9FIRM|nr:TetR/AcrR family transcriptional regulator [Desulfosporosinus nitroreducens]MCO1601663.1 TetR/AcrR family transcriptional regulator [Desulfosporosinus nitroreducens]MDO0825244.1 TetR/AcrR family transcriptional regulator [Desulfosporosinus nitroreducens]
MSKLIHTKESLILSTIEVISEKGLQGLTTREVAKRQGISESTIFKHYKSKNELILAVLEYFSQYDQAIIESLKLRDYTPIEAITYFVEAYVTYYENYPEITAITLSCEGLMCEPELNAVVYNIFIKRFNSVKSLITEAKHKKVLAKEVDPGSMADLIIGLERASVLRWRMDNYNFSLKDHTLSALKMLLDAFALG